MASWVQRQLPELLKLAHDRSEGARLLLADRLAELCHAEEAKLSAREEQLVNDLIDQLLKTQNVVVRSELVKKFADARNMPRVLAVNLASDTIDSARDILLTNEQFTDGDLIGIVENQSRDHACAIAARREVSEAVADALVTTGDLRVMQIVAENLGAHLAPRAMTVLAESCRLVVSLQRPVMQRPELTIELATRLYWWVAQDLRRHTLQRFGLALGQLDISLNKAIEEKLGEHTFEKNDDAAMIAVAEWLEERSAITPKLLPQILRLGHFRLFNIVLSRMSRLGLSLIDIIVSEPGGRTLAALCRAIAVDKANFVSIFLLSRGARSDEQIVHPRELSFALSAFDRLTPEVARDLVTSWRENPDYLLNRQQNQLALEA